MARATAAAPRTRTGDEDYHFFYNPFKNAIIVNESDIPHNPVKLFLTWPWYAPLLFPNTTSDARDHAANERTYLSYLRLAVYLAVVSVAIFINFHLKNQPTRLEVRLSHPLGIIFWLLALACLAAGFANYVRTVAKYARKAALVQSGLKTQVVFGVVSCAIIAACGVFLAAEGQRQSVADGAGNASAAAVPRVESHAIRTAEDALLKMLADMGGQAVHRAVEPDVM